MAAHYIHRTSEQHYMEAQRLLSQAQSADRARASLLIAQAQVHATLATANVEPFAESVRGQTYSVSKSPLRDVSSELPRLGYEPEDWEGTYTFPWEQTG